MTSVFAELDLIRVELDEAEETEGRKLWKVTFGATTDALEYTRLTVLVHAESAEEAAGSGRTTMVSALEDLKQAAMG